MLVILTENKKGWFKNGDVIHDYIHFPYSLQETYEAKRNEFMGELQKKEEEMRQMFVQRVKEKEAELKEAEKEVWLHLAHFNSQSILQAWDIHTLKWNCRGRGWGVR